MVRPSPVPPYDARRGAVGLREGLEDALLTVQRDADARVADREVQHDLWWRRRLVRHAKDDLAARRKLDGVPEQVDENLAQTAGVASQRAWDRRTTSTMSSRPFW